MNSAAAIGTAPGQRVWQRTGTFADSAWVLVGEMRDDESFLHHPPIDRVIATTSHRSRRRRVSAGRPRRTGDRPGWLWLFRWYRARWAGRRALRAR